MCYCFKPKNYYNSDDFNTILNTDNLDQAKSYIKSRDDMTKDMFQDAVISAFCNKLFLYASFANFIYDLHLQPYIHSDILLPFLTNNKKSKYCYLHYNEKQLEHILKNTIPYHHILVCRGMLSTSICRNYVNVVFIILQELTKLNIHQGLSYFYPHVSKYFYVAIVNLFVKYDPKFNPIEHLTNDQLKIYMSSTLQPL